MEGIQEMTKRQRVIEEEEAPLVSGGCVGFVDIPARKSSFNESIERAETRIEELKLLIKAWKDDRKS